MKKFTKTVSGIICLALLISTTAFAQIPASQKVVIIDETVPGALETTINGDVDAMGNRVNPTRIYQLKKDKIYFMNSPILFGSVTSNDTTSTLIIVGEPGGKKPVVLMDPLAGGNAFRNDVHGSLTIKNVYWPSLAINNTGSVLFQLYRSNQRLILEDFVTESCTNGDKFVLGTVKGTMDIYFKNCYFRDNTQFANPWNFATFSRSDNALPIDTLWIENTTVANAGLTFFGKGNPINFVFFDHNTIINVPKYVFFFEQYKEAYFTNNMFINCNWQGEDANMGKTQLESQAKSGAGNPPVYVGVLNLMEMNANAWTLAYNKVPKMEEVKWMASNNLHFTSPFLNKYQTGGYGDGKPYPVSYLDWGVLPKPIDFPLQVTNVPPMFLSKKTDTLVAKYPGIVAESNLIQVDPKMKTLGIADQAEGDLYAQWARNNFAITGVTLPDDATFSFGDQDGTTIPGIKSENGAGFNTVNDLNEDFSYTEDIKSKIDALHIGSLQWFPSELTGYDGKAALTNVLNYYKALPGVTNAATTIWNPAGNPTSTGFWGENDNWTDKVAPKDNKVVFNVTDAHECVLNVPSTIKQIVMADGGPGGTLRIADGGSLTTTSGWSGIGWTGEATLIVETGGTMTFGSHMWVGWEPGSKGTVMLEGGTINVTEMFGMNFENKGGIGAVYVKSGVLNLAQLAYPNSIRDGSVLDITGGTVKIAGDMVTMVNNYASDKKITADGGNGTVNAVFAGGYTTVTALHTGLRANKTGSVKVYPNPTRGILNVDNPSVGSFSYEVISVTGKVVSSKSNVTGKITQVDMTGLAKGIYVINIISEGKSIKQKVILK